MAKIGKSLSRFLGNDEDDAKRFEQRIARIEKRQLYLMNMLQRTMYAGSGIAAPEAFQAHAFALHSKRGEDGLLLHVLKEIGTRNRTFVEIGIQDGRECNTANLALNFGWRGVMMEAGPEYAAAAKDYYSNARNVTVKQAFVSKENINALLDETGADRKPDVFSLDIDGNDYWVWEAMKDFEPRVAVVEYNYTLGPNRSATIAYDSAFRYRSKFPRGYHGATLLALTRLANRRGMALVGVSDFGHNAFFVRRDCLRGALREVAPANVHPKVENRPGYAERLAAVANLDWVEIE